MCHAKEEENNTMRKIKRLFGQQLEPEDPVVGNEWLKDLIARPRPCAVDSTVALIVKKPGSFSCPSVHTYLAFSSAMAISHYYRKAGIGVYAFAAMVGFSRMYFFVHYPTDVLFGAILGVVTAFAVCWLLDRIYGRISGTTTE